MDVLPAGPGDTPGSENVPAGFEDGVVTGPPD